MSFCPSICCGENKTFYHFYKKSCAWFSKEQFCWVTKPEIRLVQDLINKKNNKM